MGIFRQSAWAISADAYEGEYAAKSGTISHSQASTIFIEMDITSDAVISFWKKVSSESSYDFLKFYINDQEMGSWSGDDDWSIESYEVSSGATTFSWTYSKDGSVSSGDDAAWIDNIIFNGTPPQPAQLSYSPGEFNVELNMNESTIETLTLENLVILV